MRNQLRGLSRRMTMVAVALTVCFGLSIQSSSEANASAISYSACGSAQLVLLASGNRTVTAVVTLNNTLAPMTSYTVKVVLEGVRPDRTWTTETLSTSSLYAGSVATISLNGSTVWATNAVVYADLSGQVKVAPKAYNGQYLVGCTVLDTTDTVVTR